MDAAARAEHVLLGTATPIQTDVADLWDLMKVMSQGVDFVLGNAWSPWRDQARVIPMITGEVNVTTDREAWEWFRNLQTLGTLIDVDLPWNPSRLEQRIGRIKRFGQRRDKVDMANLVYHGTIDEKVYETLSARMQDRYNIFGTLPDVIEDDWLEDIENLGEKLREFTTKKKQANAFDLRYGVR